MPGAQADADGLTDSEVCNHHRATCCRRRRLPSHDRVVHHHNHCHDIDGSRHRGRYCHRHSALLDSQSHHRNGAVNNDAVITAVIVTVIAKFIVQPNETIPT